MGMDVSEATSSYCYSPQMKMFRQCTLNETFLVSRIDMSVLDYNPFG
jgi:hypothetical protein